MIHKLKKQYIMEKIIQFLTGTQSDAYTVVEALKKLDEINDISLSEIFVIEKDSEGRVHMKDSEGRLADATIFGAFTGGIIGLLAGPAGMLAGSSLGLLTGSLVDLGSAMDTEDYLAEVTKKIPNGKCLVVAHVYEEWNAPIDTKLSSIAEITRIDVDEEIDKVIQSDIDSLNKDIDEAEAEIKQSVESRKEALRKKLDELKARKEAKDEELKKRLKAQKRAYKKWFKKLKAIVEA